MVKVNAKTEPDHFPIYMLRVATHKTCFRKWKELKFILFRLLKVLLLSNYINAGTIMESLFTPSACFNKTKFEPRHEISNNVVCATSKGSEQPCAYAQTDPSLC